MPPSFSRRLGATALRGSLVVFLVIVLMGLTGVVGYEVGRRGGISGVAPMNVDNAKGDEKIDFSTFWQAWNVIDKNFYGEKDANKRLNGAISGMVAGLGDPYTAYFEPSQNDIFRSDLEGSFGGIGAELVVKNNLLTVVSALEGTPAEKAGLKADDVIYQINDKKTADLSFADAITAIRGEKGSSLTLTIVRSGADKPFEVTLQRDIIVVKSVSSSAVGPDNSIAYIKVNQFGSDTVDLWGAALKDAVATGKKGVLIDLRNNPGGYMDAAVNAIGMVIPKHPQSDKGPLQQRIAVIDKDNEGHEKDMAATNDPIADTLPIVVLVNGGSASASEIYAGAMKDYGRATLVGAKTYGKGSVQNLIDLQNGGAVKVTVAKWFTPLGTGIDQTGIEPDVAVELPADVVTSSSDAQAAKALEILEQKIK